MPAGNVQNPAEYTARLVTEGFGDLSVQFVQTYEKLDAFGYPDLAAILRAAYFKLQSDLEELARKTALKATEYIKREEAESRVRPDTEGDGGKRLEDYIGFSFPLRAVPGSVGINFMPDLEANVEWWWTNEVGYSGHIGRVVHGFFYDSGFTGATNPDPTQSREHPLFRAEGPQRDSNSFGPDHDFQNPTKGAKGERPGMQIKRPVPAREFVLRGYERAAIEWHAEVKAAKARFGRELQLVLSRITPRAP